MWFKEIEIMMTMYDKKVVAGIPRKYKSKTRLKAKNTFDFWN